MAVLEFDDIKFEDRKSSSIKMIFLRLYESDISVESLRRIGEFKVKDGAIDFKGVSEKEALNKFNLLLSAAFGSLKDSLTGHRAVYVHRNSGIPLIGSLYFGIVDRGTNIIELKPITGCNLNCVFCSVSEGRESARLTDFVVEKDYLVDELKKVIDFKRQADPANLKLDIFINTQGEPLLYEPMVELVRDLRSIKEIGTISIITNASLLSSKLADDLVSAGLDQINISVNAIDPKKAQELAGTASYNIQNVLAVAGHLSSKIDVVIAPVWIKGINDDDIPKIISFAKSIGARIGIQNYLQHSKGRKISEEVSWDAFKAKLKEWEASTGVDLLFEGHESSKTKPLPKPFAKGEVVKAVIVCPGRLKNEVLAAAKGRVISVLDAGRDRGEIKVMILKDKDNTFVGKAV